MYPYRTFKSAAYEILSQHSYSNRSVTINLKENTRVYIQDDTTFFLDMESVTITSYSDTSAQPGKALIVPTAIVQTLFDQRAGFHILNNYEPFETYIDSVISTGSYQDSTLGKLSQVDTTIKFVQTNFYLLNVDVYREVIDMSTSKVFMNSIYLQDRHVVIRK